MNIKLADAISRFVDNRKKEMILSVSDVARMIQSAYDYDEFRYISEATVSEWLAVTYGWDATFTLEQANSIVDSVRNNGYRF